MSYKNSMIELIKLAITLTDTQAIKRNSETTIETKVMNSTIEFINTDLQAIDIYQLKDRFNHVVKFKLFKYDEAIHYAIMNYYAELVLLNEDYDDKLEAISLLSLFNASDKKLLLHHINEFELY